MMPDPTNLPEGCKFSDRCPYATDECRKPKDRRVNLKGEHYVLCDMVKEAH